MTCSRISGVVKAKKAGAEVKQAGAFTVQNWLEAELRAVNAPLYNRCKYKIRQTKPKKCR